MNDDLDQLERLGRLRTSGVLTEQEFSDAKAALLAGSQPAAPPAPVPAGAIQRPPVSNRSRPGLWLVASLVVAVLVGAVAGLIVWHRFANLPLASVQPQLHALALGTAPAPSAAPAQAVPTAPGPAPAPAAKAAGDDSDVDEAADDEAYYADAAPYMHIPVRVVAQGQDYCCLTMGAIHDALQPKDVAFKREDASRIDLTSTDVSTHPWRMITYGFVKEGADWRVEQIVDSAGPNYDAHSAVSPDQALVEQFKLQPNVPAKLAAQGQSAADHPLYSDQYTLCMATGDAARGVTAAILACDGAENDRQDAALNQAYRDAMSRLDPVRQATLRAFERDWLKRREAKCRTNSLGIAGGSLQAVDYSRCILDETSRRVAALDKVAR